MREWCTPALQPPVVIPAQAGIQYAAAYRFNHNRLWNTGSPAFAGDDSWGCDALSQSRGLIRPRFARNLLALQSEGAGNAGRPMRPIATCAMGSGRAHTCCQVTPESPGIPRAVVYGLYVISPVSPALLPPSPAGLTASLTPTSGVSGPHDFAIRIRRPGRERHPRPPHPRPALVTLRNAPRSGPGWRNI